MPNMKQDTEYHHCNLTGEQWDIVTKFIDSGIFVNLRRTLKRYTMISKNHPLTKSYAPSLYRLKEEEKLHLIENYNMIHPFSMFALHLNSIMSVIFLFYFTVVPFLYPVIHNKQRNYLLIPAYGANTVIMIVSFYIGYYDQERNIITMERWAVAKKYLRTYFIFDLLVFLPQLIRIKSFDEKLKAYSIYGLLAAVRVIIRYVRYIWSLHQLKIIRLYHGFSTFTYRVIRLLLNIIVGLGISIYLLYAILNILSTENGQPFLKHSESTLKMILMINHGSGIGQMKYLEEMLLPTCFIIIGFVFHLIVLVETMDICFKYFSAENQQTTIYNSINAYMRYRALPMSLRKRIYLYLEFKYQGHFYKESAIRKVTSANLRREILLAATTESIQKVDLFFKIPGHLLKKIGAILVAEIFLPGDVIIKAGNTGQCMFFLLAGTVVVTSAEDKEICYLRDGSHFGEVALVTNIARVANVMAITPCELFKLDREYFWEVVKKYPTLWKDIEAIVTERIANVGQSVPSSSVDISATVKIEITKDALNKIIDMKLKMLQDVILPKRAHFDSLKPLLPQLNVKPVLPGHKLPLTSSSNPNRLWVNRFGKMPSRKLNLSGEQYKFRLERPSV